MNRMLLPHAAPSLNSTSQYNMLVKDSRMKFLFALRAFALCKAAWGSIIPLSTKLQQRSCLPALNFTAQLDYVGCFTDPVNPRTLAGASFASAMNSPKYCGDLCGQAGYSYVGVEYSRLVFSSKRRRHCIEYNMIMLSLSFIKSMLLW